MVRVFLKGGVWKNSEDEILKAAVQKYGKQVSVFVLCFEESFLLLLLLLLLSLTLTLTVDSFFVHSL